VRAAVSTAPASSSTSATQAPITAAATAPTAKYATQRSRGSRPVPARCHAAGIRPTAACTATAATAAPAPAAAPRTYRLGVSRSSRAESARIATRPGAMKQTPPTIAPSAPRNRQAQ
jgi:hypothetical protein